jgi:hypothetical protein
MEEVFAAGEEAKHTQATAMDSNDVVQSIVAITHL